MDPIHWALKGWFLVSLSASGLVSRGVVSREPGSLVGGVRRSEGRRSVATMPGAEADPADA